MFAISQSVKVILSVSENVNSSDSMLHKLNTSELINKLRLTTGQNNFALYLSIKSLKIFFTLMSFI